MIESDVLPYKLIFIPLVHFWMFTGLNFPVNPDFLPAPLVMCRLDRLQNAQCIANVYCIALHACHAMAIARIAQSAFLSVCYNTCALVFCIYITSIVGGPHLATGPNSATPLKIEKTHWTKIIRAGLWSVRALRTFHDKNQAKIVNTGRFWEKNRKSYSWSYGYATDVLHRDQCNLRKRRLCALSMRQRGGEVRANCHRANKMTLFTFDGKS